jgi:hypothetical protein
VDGLYRFSIYATITKAGTGSFSTTPVRQFVASPHVPTSLQNGGTPGNRDGSCSINCDPTAAFLRELLGCDDSAVARYKSSIAAKNDGLKIIRIPGALGSLKNNPS